MNNIILTICKNTRMTIVILVLVVVTIGAAMTAWQAWRTAAHMPAPVAAMPPAGSATAVLAGGCFWCTESDFAKLHGVTDVVSGYTGGTSAHPTYEDYAADGHREAVLVTYDPTVVSYAALVQYLIKHSDPTDASGSFNDRGAQYTPAIYYATDDEKRVAAAVIAAVDARHIYPAPLTIALEPRAPFYGAESYHQDYAAKNPLRYDYYRDASGRDAFIAKYWGTDTLPDATLLPTTVSVADRLRDFHKPSADVLRARLTQEQYDVTQNNGTEPAFDNIYNANKADGIYVDIVSGEPLFASRDKYDSGTGWPSFVAPIAPSAITLREDNTLFAKRVEVRSAIADSHLGHVFDDGPANRGGKRYCMNSAALRFIPAADLAAQGYSAYLPLFAPATTPTHK